MEVNDTGFARPVSLPTLWHNAGRFRIVAERIGYRTYTGPVFSLADGETRRETIAAPAEAITLEGVTAVGDRRCRVRPAEGLAAARVWDEARKALTGFREVGGEILTVRLPGGEIVPLGH